MPSKGREDLGDLAVPLSTIVKIERSWLRAKPREEGHQPADRRLVTLASLLRGGVQNLPSTVRRAQVRPHKPGFIPDVEIPADRTIRCGAWPRPHSTGMAKPHISDLTLQCPRTQVSLLWASYCVRPRRALSP